MKCEVKNNIKGFASLSGGSTVSEIKQSVLDAGQVYTLLEDKASLIKESDPSSIREDNRNLTKALKKIPSFTEFGMIIAKGVSQINSAGNTFLQNVVTNAPSAKMAVSTLSKGKSAIVSTQAQVDSLNTLLNETMSTLVTSPSENYLSLNKKGELVVSNKFTTDYNNYVYAQYQQRVGAIAQEVVYHSDTPEEFDEGVLEMQAGPVVSHINSQISTLNKTRRAKAANNTLTSYEDNKISSEISKLSKKRQSLNKKMTAAKLYSHAEDIIDDAASALASNRHLTSSDVSQYLGSLELVINSSDYSDKNTVVEASERRDAELMAELTELAGIAKGLQHQFTKLSYTKVEDDMLQHDFIAKGSITFVKGARSAMKKWFSSVLGPQHIQNPIVQYLWKLVQKTEIIANKRARALNDKLEKLLNKVKDFDMKNIYQRNEENRLTGRMIDELSAKYWKTANKRLDNPKKRAHRKSNFIELNPELLFDEKYADKRGEFEKVLKDQLGPRLYKRFTEEAREKWDAYNETLMAFESTSPTDKELKSWIIQNSPIERIKNLGNKKINTSDRYLVTAPRRINLLGNETGYYDKDFHKVLNNKEAYEFYKAVRAANVRQNEALSHYEELHKPPKIGYVNKTMVELSKEGRYSEAFAIVKNEANKFGRGSLVRKGRPTEEISGMPDARIQTQLHSLGDEIIQRRNSILEDDVEYRALIARPSTPEIEGKLTAIKEEAFNRASIEAEAFQSDDFIQAIALSNYDTELLIEKTKVEAEVLLASRLLYKEGSAKESNTDEGQKEVDLAVNTAKHMLNMKFYGYADKESGFTLNPITAEKLEKDLDLTDKEKVGVTEASIGNAANTAFRTIALGWHATNGVRNLFQGLISNTYKAWEGHHFNPRDLGLGYAKVFKPKSRKLIDYLYILGDVAHQHDKRTIHGDSSWTSKLNPMVIQTEVEKINQGATAIAILEKIQVTDGKKTISLYEAITEEGELDAKWSTSELEGLTGDDLIAEVVVTRIRPLNSEAHGDYISPLIADRSMPGKMFTTFTKYIFDMHQDRFGLRFFDGVQGRDKEGRYISVAKKLAEVLTTNDIASIDVNTPIGKMLMEYSEDNDEITEAGVRAAFSEIITILMLFGTTFFLKKAYCDTPQCKEGNWAAIASLNLLGTLGSDMISVAASPLTLLQKSGEPFAIVGMLENFSKLIGGMGLAAVGADSGFYQKDTDDYDEGTPKFYKELKSLSPLYNNVITRPMRMGKSLYPNWLWDNFGGDEE